MKTIYILKAGKAGLTRDRKLDHTRYAKGLVELRQRLEELNKRDNGQLTYQEDYLGAKPLDYLE